MPPTLHPAGAQRIPIVPSPANCSQLNFIINDPDSLVYRKNLLPTIEDIVLERVLQPQRLFGFFQFSYYLISLRDYHDQGSARHQRSNGGHNTHVLSALAVYNPAVTPLSIETLPTQKVSRRKAGGNKVKKSCDRTSQNKKTKTKTKKPWWRSG